MEYVEKLYSSEVIPAADSLIAGTNFLLGGTCTVAGEGEYVRGEIVVSSGDSFTKATADSLSSATEAAIISRGMTLEDDMTAQVTVYFSGAFSAKCVSLSGKMFTELEQSKQSAVIGALRKHKIFLQ